MVKLWMRSSLHEPSACKLKISLVMLPIWQSHTRHRSNRTPNHWISQRALHNLVHTCKKYQQAAELSSSQTYPPVLTSCLDASILAQGNGISWRSFHAKAAKGPRSSRSVEKSKLGETCWEVRRNDAKRALRLSFIYCCNYIITIIVMLHKGQSGIWSFPHLSVCNFHDFCIDCSTSI
jgi:hypothetical protein